MMGIETYVDSVLREQWDDDTRTFTAWDAAGVQTEQRPYTAQENADADDRVLAETEQANESTVRTTTDADLAALATSIDNLNTVINKTNASIGPADTKQVAREARAIARATRRLIRLVLERYDGAD